MEAIGSAATIVQLISFTGELLALGYGYLSKVKKAPSEIRALLKETAALNELLDQIFELNDDQEIPSDKKVENALSALTRLGVLDDCEKLMATVERMLKACTVGEGQGVKNAAKRLLWPFKEKDTKDLLEQLGRLREVLSAAIVVDSAKTLKVVEECAKNIDRNMITALEDIAALHDDLNDIKVSTHKLGESIVYIKAATMNKIEEEEKLAIRKWLCPDGIGNDSRLNESLALRHPETGLWFVKVVENWMREDQSCIWFHGIAGSGKTVLAAMAVEYLRTEALLSSSIVLHFFCDRQDPEKQSMQDLLFTITKQLLDQNAECIADAKLWRDERMISKGGSIANPLTQSEYTSLVQQLCSRWNRVILVVDALDEGSDPEEMAQGLTNLTQGTNFRLLLTSRFEVEMQRVLQPLATSQVPLYEPMQEDIRMYLNSEIPRRIASGNLKFRTPGLDQKIMAELQKKADGMILLAKLHLDYICALKSDRAIKDALITLPSKIYPTYDEILDQICLKNQENIEDLRSILQWLTYSVVPLNLQQLAEVVSIREGDTCLDESGIVTDYMDLVALCGSLVTVITDGTDSKSSIIKLSHASVEEYLKSNKIRSDLADIFALGSETANLSIVKTCLQYISFEDFEKPIEVELPISRGLPRKWRSSDRRCLASRTSKYALADYASRYWPEHLRRLNQGQIAERSFANYLEWFVKSVENEGKYESWQQMYHRDVRYYCKGRPALHYAIEFKIDSLASKLLPAKENINELVGGKSALHVAARCGSLSTITELISLGADVNLASGTEEKGMVVLHFAAEGGQGAAIKLLLKHGASVNSRSTSQSTPLYRAARSGSLEALQILYDAGSELDAVTWDNWTPLFESISHGRRRISSQLLQWGANPTIKTLQGESAVSILQRNKNGKMREENPTLSGAELRSKLVTSEDILASIDSIKKMSSEKERKEGFDLLVKGLPTHYVLVQSMEKDTRPGTEREKDQRFPHDASFIITATEYRENYDEEDAKPPKFSPRLKKWVNDSSKT